MPKKTSTTTTQTSSIKPRPGGWSIEQTDSNVYRLNISAKSRVGWEQWCLLTSDRHWDNPKSDWKLQQQHLEKARERNAFVIDCGDFFCAMQGKYDPRSSKSALRPEHQGNDYFDALVRTGANFFQPYADLFAVIGRGNHELSIRQRNETDLTERLVATLIDRTGFNVQAGGYSGWCVFAFNFASTERYSRVLRWTHGHGGGGPVTEDIIAGQRATVNFDADYLASGHTHHSWNNDRVRQRISQHGVLESRIMRLIKIPSYKDAFNDGRDSWEITRGHPPKPIGCTWIRWYWDNGLQEEILSDVRAGLT